MHGSLAANQALLAALKARLGPREGISYAVCAPYPYLQQVAAALARILSEPETWQAFSEAALSNAERYRWDVVSPPFVEVFDELAKA